MKRLTVAFFLVAFCLCVFAGVSGFAFPPARNGSFRDTPNTGGRFVPGQLLVKFKEGAGGGAIGLLEKRFGTAEARPLTGSDVALVEFDGDVEKAVDLLRASGLVEIAVPNYIRRAARAPNDPAYPGQWNFKEPVSGGGIDMEAAWDRVWGGRGDVEVAVIDTGVAYENRGFYRQAPDLADTQFTQGYDYVNNDSYPNDDNWHGTHICGTIAQSTDNGLGVAGIAFGCTVMPVKVLDAKGVGSDADIIMGIRYAADRGADVLNLSLSGEDPNPLLEEAVDYAASKGCVVCAASGNEGDSPVHYPAAYDSCIAVGATTRQRGRADYSNYGSALDVVAPGGSGAGRIIQQTFKHEGQPAGGFELVQAEGTSMSTAHVAGVAALLKSLHPTWSAADIRGAIASTAADLGDPGWDREFGFGLIDAGRAVRASRLPTPKVSGISSDHGTRGEVVRDLAISGSGFSPAMKVTLEREGEDAVTATGVRVTGSGKIKCDIDISRAQPGLWDVKVENAAGRAAVLEGGFAVDPVNSRTWYLAEGSTAHNFEEFILVQNPGDAPANVSITFMTKAGAENPYPAVVPPKSRYTLRANDVIPDRDVSAMIEADRDVICERAMYWGGRIEGTDSLGVQSPSHTWYLAEGSTAHGFETYLLVQNPSSRAATVVVTYMTPEGPVEKEPFSIPGYSRRTVRVKDDIPANDVSFKVSADNRVIAERSMYWDGKRGGHVSTGTTAPAREWYLAEGTTDWGYDEYILLQNPGDGKATVRLTYMTPEGPVQQPSISLQGGSRHTIHVNEALPGSDLSVRASSDRGIVVERAMYWNNGTGKAGHGAIGVPQARRECFLAEGSTDWGFEEWVLIQNPNDDEASVGVEYMTGGGLRTRDGFIIGANSRVTVFVNGDVPGTDTSTYVYSNLPIIAERAMYWNSRGAGHVSTGMMR